MSITSKGKPVRVTGDIGNANVTADGPPSQQVGPLIGAGGMGMVNADNTNAAKCTKEGEPVDVVTGEVLDDANDLWSAGIIPVVWARTYSSGRCAEETSLGRGGWMHSFDLWVDDSGSRILVRDTNGRDVPFQPLNVGERGFKRGKRWDLFRDGPDEYRLEDVAQRRTRIFRRLVPGGRAYLVEVRDPRGNQVELNYSGERLDSLVDTAGRTCALTHDQVNRIIEVALVVGGKPVRRVAYEYHTTGELARVVDPRGYAERFEYDGLHRMVAVTRANGATFRFEYDEFGRCVHTHGDGGLYNVELHFDDRALTTTTTGSNKPRIYAYNAQRAIIREQTLDGSTVHERDYDADLLVVAYRNAAGQEAKYEFDDRGHLVSETDPAGNVTAFEYIDDWLHKRTDPGGITTVYQRNQFYELVSVAQPTGAVLTATWDRYGRVESLSGPDGELIRTTYDAAHNLVELRNFRGAVKRYTYNEVGEETSRTDALGGVHRMEYDAGGYPVRAYHPDGTSTELEYDALGKLVWVRDGSGKESRLEYAGLGALERYIGPDGASWRFKYDSDQQLRTIINPKGERYEFDYDAIGRVIEERLFDGQRIRYAFNNASLLHRIEYDDGTWRQFEYDQLGEIVVEDSSHSRVEITRDSIGRMLAAEVIEGGTTTSKVEYERDQFGRVIAETQNGRRTEYELDSRGRLVARTLPTGDRTEYARDAFGALNAVRHNGHSVEFERDVAGREVRRTIPQSGLELRSEYDSNGLCVSQWLGLFGAAQPVSARTWDYDRDGRVVREQDHRRGDTSYRYDPVGQLLSAHSRLGQESFEYDAAGALSRVLSDLTGQREQLVLSEGSRVERTDSAKFSYDRRGRRTSKTQLQTGETTTYVWDCREQLRQVELPDGSVVRYYYDYQGRRVRKEFLPSGRPDEATFTDFVYAGHTLAVEYVGQAAPRVFVYGPAAFVPLMQQEGTTIFDCVSDMLGRPRELIDPQGRVAWSTTYTSFGRAVDASSDEASTFAGQVRCPFGLLGQYRDDETGLAYNLFRYFDAEVGGWISPDPLGIVGCSNLYGMDEAPTVGADPWGLADHGQVGTYGRGSDDGLNHPDHRGDKMDADELLLNGFIKAHRDSLNEGWEHRGHGSGNASTENPAIALEGRGKPPRGFGEDGTHAQIWRWERENGFHDPDTLKGLTAREVIDRKAAALEAILKKHEDFTPEEAKKIVARLKKKALAHARRIFPPCVVGDT